MGVTNHLSVYTKQDNSQSQDLLHEGGTGRLLPSCRWWYEGCRLSSFSQPQRHTAGVAMLQALTGSRDPGCCAEISQARTHTEVKALNHPPSPSGNALTKQLLWTCPHSKKEPNDVMNDKLSGIHIKVGWEKKKNTSPQVFWLMFINHCRTKSLYRSGFCLLYWIIRIRSFSSRMSGPRESITLRNNNTKKKPPAYSHSGPSPWHTHHAELVLHSRWPFATEVQDWHCLVALKPEAFISAWFRIYFWRHTKQNQLHETPPGRDYIPPFPHILLNEMPESQLSTHKSTGLPRTEFSQKKTKPTLRIT